MKLSDALDWYWTAKVDLSPATRRDYALTFRRLSEFVGADKQIEEITAREAIASGAARAKLESFVEFTRKHAKTPA